MFTVVIHGNEHATPHTHRDPVPVPGPQSIVQSQLCVLIMSQEQAFIPSKKFGRETFLFFATF